MILETETTTVVSNLSDGVESFSGTISEEDFQYLMPILSNLYNDPKGAVVREMSTNGRDSHVEAGNSEPVLITLPDYDTKTFIVQDFGVGMSVDDVKNIYSHYGRSTKRTSNTQVGAFGLGCKSPLAIASQFTIVTVKDGKKANILIQKDPNTGLKALVVGEVDTDEPNGVTVSIPVSGVGDFNRTALNFYRFAEPGAYLVDGKKPESAYANATPMHDEYGVAFGYMEVNNSGASFVVMGGVPYELTAQEIRNSGERLGLDFSYNSFGNAPKYFPVPIGSVDLTPNREGLRFTDRTITFVDSLLKAMHDGLKATASEEVDSIENRASIFPVLEKWKRYGFEDLKWNGEDIQRTIALKGQYSSIDRRRGGYGRKDSFHGQGRVIDVFKEDQVIVTGQPWDKYRRITSYLGDYVLAKSTHDMRRKLFIFLEDDEMLASPWITENSNFLFTTFEEIIETTREYRREKRRKQREYDKLRGIGPVRQSATKASGKPTYTILDIATGERSAVPYDQIAADIVYIDSKDIVEWRRGRGNYLYDAVQGTGAAKTVSSQILEFVPDLKQVLLLEGVKNVDTFKKRIPGAVNFATIVDRVTAEFKASITDTMRAAYTATSRYGYEIEKVAKVVNSLDLSKVLDPKIVASTSLRADGLKFVERVNKYKSFVGVFTLQSVGTTLGSDDFGLADPYAPEVREFSDVTNLFSSYPLMKPYLTRWDSLDETTAEHILMYINAVYSTLVNAKNS